MKKAKSFFSGMFVAYGLVALFFAFGIIAIPTFHLYLFGANIGQFIFALIILIVAYLLSK